MRRLVPALVLVAINIVTCSTPPHELERAERASPLEASRLQRAIDEAHHVLTTGRCARAVDSFQAALQSLHTAFPSTVPLSVEVGGGTSGSQQQQKQQQQQQQGKDEPVPPYAQRMLATIYVGLAQALVQCDTFAPALSLYERLLKMEISDLNFENAIKGSALGGYAIALTKVGSYKQATRVAKQVKKSASAAPIQLAGSVVVVDLTSARMCVVVASLIAVVVASGVRPLRGVLVDVHVVEWW